MTSEAFHAVMVQTGYYACVMVLTAFFIGAWQRGFFLTYFKVRFSWGKYVMVKVRSPLRDYFMKGWVDEGFLMYEIKRSWKEKDIIRLNIPKKGPSPFYKCMSVTWVDVDDEKHAICQTDYSTVTGYDAIKNNNLHQRALMRPSLTNGMEKMMMAGIVICAILAGLALMIAWKNGQAIGLLQQGIKAVLQKGTVIGGGL